MRDDDDLTLDTMTLAIALAAALAIGLALLRAFPPDAGSPEAAPGPGLGALMERSTGVYSI